MSSADQQAVLEVFPSLRRQLNMDVQPEMVIPSGPKRPTREAKQTSYYGLAVIPKATNPSPLPKFYDLARRMALRIRNLPESFGFHTAASLETFPDYLDVVKDPIDMLLIHRRFEAREYETFDEVVFDFQLLFNNAILYNTKGSNKREAKPLAESAKQLLKVLEAEQKEIRGKLTPAQLSGTTAKPKRANSQPTSPAPKRARTNPPPKTPPPKTPPPKTPASKAIQPKTLQSKTPTPKTPQSKTTPTPKTPQSKTTPTQTTPKKKALENVVSDSSTSNSESDHNNPVHNASESESDDSTDHNNTTTTKSKTTPQKNKRKQTVARRVTQALPTKPKARKSISTRTSNGRQTRATVDTSKHPPQRKTREMAACFACGHTFPVNELTKFSNEDAYWCKDCVSVDNYDD